MTDEPLPSRSPVQETASQLAGILGGFDEEGDPLSDVESKLSPELRALVSDSFGLLNGIANGMITTGQPRVRDNLVKIIAQLPQEQSVRNIEPIISLLNLVISRAATCGLTAQDQELAPGRFVDKIRT